MSESAMVLLAYCISSVIITVILVKFCKRNRHQHYEVPARDITKGHRWVMTHMFPHPIYCVVSGQHIFDGAFCDSCGLCVDDHNIKVANTKFSCKNFARQNTNNKHHWVKGNLPLCSKCNVCHEQCGVLPQLCDLRCCWCQRTIHEHCLNDLQENNCDLGQFGDLIVPPNCVQLKLVGWKGRKHLVVDSVRVPPIPKWSPMIVIGNRKSGNEDGDRILQKFRSCLNPAQVVDLHDLPPEAGLEWCHLVPDIPCRVLVAGGDGTVCWVLNAIENLKLNPAPYLSILPLGTGNDLSRVTGWGDGHVGVVDVSQIMQKIEEADCAKLDRWKVSIVNRRKRMGISLLKRTKVVMMNNYASVGVDARVTLNFHNHRQSQPSLFGNRLINKFWYFTYGTRDLYTRECKDLHSRIKLELDGVTVDLPAVEGIVVLNISSWGGGCQPWGTDLTPDARPQRFDDGLLEVMGLYSSFHIAQLQVGLAEPLRLGQAKKVKLSRCHVGLYSSFHIAQLQVGLAEPLRLGQAKKVKITLTHGRSPIQVDGEPWNQSPGEITITHSSQASILVHRNSLR